MFKIIFACIVSCSMIIAAAAADQTPDLVDTILEPQIVAQRSGIYRVTLNRDIVNRVREDLKASFTTDTHPVSSEVTAFEEALRILRYPHPNTIDSTSQTWTKFRTLLHSIRSEYALPFFPTTTYTTPYECMTAFELFVAEQLPGERYTTTRRTIKTKLAEKFSAIEMEVAQLYDAYERFYTSRTNSFRTHDIERYVAGLLRFNSGTPIDESADRVLAILVANGFLEVQGDIVDHVFRYSLRRMVDTYIAAKGTPSKIVLGCGHANTREMFECFGLPSETWCGCCKDLPHDDAMVVSLHELSADILCELNHLDLWEPLKDGSVDAIHDETWCLSCYRPETLDHIARVLRMGGEFVSNSYSIDAPIKDQMIERGFEVIEENLEQQILRMRKSR